LNVLDAFGGLGDLDGRRAVDPCTDDRTIEIRQVVPNPLALPADDLYDVIEPVLAITGDRPFGRVPDVEVLTGRPPRGPLDGRQEHLLGRSRVDR
jgi:hypothetical protein